MSSFTDFLRVRGIMQPRITKSGRADRRSKLMAKLEDEWFNLTIKGEPMCPLPAEPEKESCPVCYDTLGAAHATTPCGHKFCISCFTQSVRESDNCAMCRAPLSDKKPKKIEPMPLESSHEVLGSILRDMSESLITGLYDTIHHDITEMDETADTISVKPGATHRATAKAIRDMRVEKTANILELITERYMVFGYNVLHRSNHWFTETSPFPFDPVLLGNNLPSRRLSIRQ